MDDKEEIKLCRTIFNTEHFEPIFISLFGIKIPVNFKPNSATELLKTPELSDQDFEMEKLMLKLGEVEKIIEKNFEIAKLNKFGGELFPNHEVRCLKPQFCKWRCSIDEEVKDFLEKYNDFPISLEKRKKLDRRCGVSWLANSIGQEKRFRGLTIEGLNSLPNDFYQMEQQDSSSKGFFRVISTSENRRVSIRVEVWNQYGIERHRSIERHEMLIDFFTALEAFEVEISDLVESFFFYFDEYTDRVIEIKLKNGLMIKSGRFGFDVDFNIWLHEIKKGQNTR